MSGIYPITINKQSFSFPESWKTVSDRLQAYFSDAWNFSVAQVRMLPEILKVLSVISLQLYTNAVTLAVLLKVENNVKIKYIFWTFWTSQPLPLSEEQFKFSIKMNQFLMLLENPAKGIKAKICNIICLVNNFN